MTKRCGKPIKSMSENMRPGGYEAEFRIQFFLLLGVLYLSNLSFYKGPYLPYWTPQKLNQYNICNF